MHYPRAGFLDSEQAAAVDSAGTRDASPCCASVVAAPPTHRSEDDRIPMNLFICAIARVNAPPANGVSGRSVPWSR